MPRGAVIAVERHPQRAQWIRECIVQTGAWSLEVVQAAMPDIADDLPEPGRIFIGGGARNASLLHTCCKRLKAGGRLAATCVLLESLAALQKELDSLAWDYEVTQIGFSHSRSLDGGTALKAENPVFLVTAQKPEAGA
jgi:precorrin-6Y C5,15-methyltransferase (decarboxylating)